jgi:L-asparaginase II
MAAVPMIELWRGGLLESRHHGHAVVFGPGGVEQVWGDADAVIFPRSSCKMIQALPLVESGAADAAGLTGAHLALACASHSGAAVHTDMVTRWLADLGMGEGDLRCGAHMPSDPDARDRLIRAREGPCQIHNNCSGKHTGFLTMVRRMKAGPEYAEIDHPLQRAIRQVTEEVTGVDVAGWGIDGCSAPNFATTMTGLARAMAAFAAADPEGGTRDRAMARLWHAMAAHPILVAGEGKACTDLMRATGGRVALKTGAEAVYVAILPDQKRGIAIKIEDGGTRASEAALTALLVRLGALEAEHPAVAKYLTGPLRNWRGLEAADLRLAEGFA